MTSKELYDIKGGASSVSGTLISSLVKMVTLLVDLGRQVGSGIRYATEKRKCN